MLVEGKVGRPKEGAMRTSERERLERVVRTEKNVVRVAYPGRAFAPESTRVCVRTAIQIIRMCEKQLTGRI